ncbi:hypothetical protein Q664_30915 [Archangium violaceum Cb vi76]|uniref:Uncharacterized protein n=1 Tax=Archangium violaceum Cb vi76 TaxID=1406225 RepID=A0A084SNG6_9BACT|nr:hypothetical protein Q664_30915 [Archangium violaceum Cb vi76]
MELGHPTQSEPFRSRRDKFLALAAIDEIAKAVAHEDRLTAQGETLVGHVVNGRTASSELDTPGQIIQLKTEFGWFVFGRVVIPEVVTTPKRLGNRLG